MPQFTRFLILLGAAVIATAAPAQLGPEIARKHAGRAGEKLAALTALRAEGRMFVGGEMIAFVSLAQRPNRLRVESFTPLRRVVQGYDGVNPPWIAHTELKGGSPQDMSRAETKDFIGNADFDGPLVNYAEKNYSVDFAGEEPVGGKPAYKLLMMSKGEDIFFLWVDAQSYEVVKRSVFRVFNNQRMAVDTFFEDFREVGGVLQPFRIETVAHSRTLYVMIVDRMEANPSPIPPESFARPAGPRP
jgi:hypothetical protein